MKLSNNIQLFSLLYVAEFADGHPVNLSSREKDPIEVYVKCAILLAKSLKYFGYEFTLLTNNLNRVDSVLKRVGYALCVKEIAFARQVPPNIKFHSAHFKLDVFDYFATLPEEYLYGLIDLDVVMVDKMFLPESNPKEATLYVYDISGAEIESFGQAALVSSISKVANCKMEKAFWYGGELIIGAPNAFSKLSEIISTIWPNYLSALSALHHIGDEMLVTTAIAFFEKQGGVVKDVGVMYQGGAKPVVARWWSARTPYAQRRFSQVDVSILHLPADKSVLAKLCDMDFSPALFKRKFLPEITWKIRLRRLLSPILNIINRAKRHAARL